METQSLFNILNKYHRILCLPICILLTSLIPSCHSLLLKSPISTNTLTTLHIFSDPHPPIHTLLSFHLPSLSELTELIQKSKLSTCQLDPLSTHLVKSCLPSLLPIISAIIHSSLTTGTVPTSLKTAVITPILKKPGADPSILNNFCPIGI